jgi:hypothetical protein
MNLTHIHLLLNHVPVLGTVIGLGLLLYGTWRKSPELKRAAAGLLVVVALLAVPVYLTGEPAEHDVESLPGVSKHLIEEHEEAASVAFTGVLILGVLALTGLFLSRGGREVPAGFGTTLLAASLIVSGLMAWTANRGGQIRHTEIRSEASPAPVGVNRDKD